MTESITLSGRGFIALSAASVIVTSAGKLQAGGLHAQGDGKPWYATMRRCGQINFNDRDPLTMDTGAWADYWASLRVDAALLNGGGIVAFYPTQVPYHHRS